MPMHLVPNFDVDNRLLTSLSKNSMKIEFLQKVVIPAKAGIQAVFGTLLDSGFRRNDVRPHNLLLSYRINRLLGVKCIGISHKFSTWVRYY